MFLNLMKGKVEVVPDIPKRKPGRPKKSRDLEEEIGPKVKKPLGRLKKEQEEVLPIMAAQDKANCSALGFAPVQHTSII